MSRTIVSVLFLVLMPIGACSSSSSTDSGGATTGQLGAGGAKSYGCSDNLIDQQKQACHEQCSPAASLGVKFCMTDDPTGQGGNIQAPCDCAPGNCGGPGQQCCSNNGCGVGNACVSNVCEPVPDLAHNSCLSIGTGPCVGDADCCDGLVCDSGSRLCVAQ
jgi:hypothetical protein